MKQQLISFLQSGASPAAVPESNTLNPAVRLPLLATTAWVLLHDDPAMLELVYPRVSSIVMERFEAVNMTIEGLIPGDGRLDPGEVHISPAINALGCLELHSLALIASAVGKYEDAIEFRNWSRQYSSIVVDMFYDNSHDCFYSRSAEGHFIAGHSPSLLLPLVVDRTISPTVRKRMADRLLYNIETWRGSLDDDPLWAEPALRHVIISLLTGLEGFPSMRLKALSESPAHRNPSATSTGRQDPWTEMWNGMPARERLFTPGEGIMSLLLFRDMARRERLLSERALPGFEDDIDALAEALSAPPERIRDHIDNIGHVNSLLLRMSEISNYLKTEEKLWKILDVETWKRLSPRTKKMLSASALLSIEELNSIKSGLTSSFLKLNGLALKVTLPDMPVPVGSLIDLKVSISSADSIISLERIYLQSAGNRWNLSSDGETFRTGPGLPPIEWQRTLRLPAGSMPGIVPLPVFMDFITAGKRVELHLAECVSVTTGYEVSLDMPSGMMLAGDDSLPLGISLRYQTGNTVHGQVDGVFLDGLVCTPSLPARFAVKGRSEITNLPLRISSKSRPAPGRYPFTLAISVDGNRIASFEKDIVVPIDWLHIGPVKNRRWALEEGYQLQDDLSSAYFTPEGKQLRWERVAEGALGPSGEVFPEHLYGSGSDRSMLLYTMVTVPSEKRVYWKLATDNIVSLWINSDPLLESADRVDAHQGTAVLRQGRNSILIAACWPGAPSRIDFEVMDDAGLPVADMKNDLSVLPQPAVAALDDKTADTGLAPPAGGSHVEVGFVLDWPDASEVSVIGEFNNWDAAATPMKKTADGRWSASVALGRGTHAYKFLVDRTSRIQDPANDRSEPDGFGGTNSLIDVK